MKLKKKDENYTLVEMEKKILNELKDWDITTPNYQNRLNVLKQVHALRMEEEELKAKRGLNPNTLVSGGINLAGILTILNFEKLGTITSKALSFVHKTRI